MRVYRGSAGIPPVTLNLDTINYIEMSGGFYTQATVCHRESALDTHSVGGWIDPRANLDVL
jgi:hypothetical protein